MKLIADLERHLIIEKGRNIRVGWRYMNEYPKYSTGTKNRKDAERIGKKIFDDWQNGATKFKAVRKDAFDIEVERYLKSSKKHIKPSTKKALTRSLDKLKEGLGLSSVVELTRDKFDLGSDSIRGKANPKYWCNIMGDVRCFVKWCIEEKLLPHDPTTRLVLPTSHEFTYKGEEVVWPDDEFETVCENLSKQDSDYLKILRYSGMDVSDMCVLEKGHVIKSTDGLTFSKVRQKEKQRFIVPVFPQILSIVKKAMKSDTKRIFSQEIPEPFGSNFGKRVRRVRRKLKLEERAPCKDLRHTFITDCVEKGVPFDVIRNWIGHSKDSRTLEKRYAHRRDSRKFMELMT